MKSYLQRKRLTDQIGALRIQAARTDRERMPLDFARVSRDLADLYAGSGKRSDAVRWYGQSIDAYLYAGLADAATAMCRRLIQFEPRVIRARATLAMLHIARHNHDEAVEEIRGYVDATRERGLMLDVTMDRLRVFADLAEDLDVRTSIALCLEELGAGEVAGEVMRCVQRERRGEATVVRLTDGERWDRLLTAVLAAPDRSVDTGTAG